MDKIEEILRDWSYFSEFHQLAVLDENAFTDAAKEIAAEIRSELKREIRLEIHKEQIKEMKKDPPAGYKLAT